MRRLTSTRARRIASFAFCGLALVSCAARVAKAQAAASGAPAKIIIDTDIGDDIDDAFAVALALRSPEVQILGITTTFGDTQERAKLLDRLLGETDHEDIPVAVGISDPKIQTTWTQRAYAEGGHFARKSHPQAVDF